MSSKIQTLKRQNAKRSEKCAKKQKTNYKCTTQQSKAALWRAKV